MIITASLVFFFQSEGPYDLKVICSAAKRSEHDGTEVLFTIFFQARLTKHVEKLLMFMKIQHEVEVWIEEMSETISRLSPVSEDGEKAKAQLANAKVGKRSGVDRV